jgi:hypothetical protein
MSDDGASLSVASTKYMPETSSIQTEKPTDYKNAYVGMLSISV